MFREGYSRPYRTAREHTKNICANAPGYIRSFRRSLEGVAAPTTIYYHCYHIARFLKYLKQTDPIICEYALRDVPVSVFLDLDEEGYCAYLSSLQGRSPTSSITPRFKSQVGYAFHAFYDFLAEQGYTCSCPAPPVSLIGTKKEMLKLTREDINTLIAGMQRNDMHYQRTPPGTPNRIMPASKKHRLRQQKHIKRNLSIILLIVNEGLTLQEICSLNVTDIDWERNVLYVRKTNVQGRDVSCSDETMDMLYDYIFSPSVPKVLLNRQEDPDVFYQFCRSHMAVPSDDPYFRKLTRDTFQDVTPELIKDIEFCQACFRNSGRKAYFPYPANTALFPSTSVRRIALRTVEVAVSEATKLYLPKYTKDRYIGPDVLRVATAGLRRN